MTNPQAVEMLRAEENWESSSHGHSGDQPTPRKWGCKLLPWWWLVNLSVQKLLDQMYLSFLEISKKVSSQWYIYDLMSLDGGQFSVYCIVAWCTGPSCSIILFIHWVIVSLGPIQSRPPTSLTLTVIHSCYLFMFFLKRWDSEKML